MAKLIKEKKLVINSHNVMITRNQDEENAELKGENLEFKEKILTREENEKEKGELTGLAGDFNFSDAGGGKIDGEQGLVLSLQLSDQSQLVKIGAVDIIITKKECRSSKELSEKLKKRASIINAVQTFNVNEINIR